MNIYILIELKSKGHKICGYGASGRANMICNLAEITPDIVKYIVDECVLSFQISCCIMVPTTQFKKIRRDSSNVFV